MPDSVCGRWLRPLLLAGMFQTLLFASWNDVPAFAQSDTDIVQEIANLDWIPGPRGFSALQNATLQLPENFIFLDAAGTEKFMHLLENPTNGVVQQVFAPADLHWFALLSFSADGYVEDREALDEDAILESIKMGTEAANEVRRKNGWSELHVIGWRRTPYYDGETNRLEWALDAKDTTGQVSTNFQTKILGRRGVTSATLVTDPTQLDVDLAEFKRVLAGYEFNAGDRYSEFQSGDKVASYGLAALIIGGAAAVAAKTGILKTLGKFILIAAIAVIATIGGFFRKIFRKRT